MPKTLETIVQIVMALLGAYVAALWFCLVVWTFRDIQKRTRDLVVQVLATALVVLFNVPGLVLYLILRPPETLDETYARALEAEALLKEVEGGSLCPRCQTRTDPDFRVCPSCRAPLRLPCDDCGRLVQVNWTVCPYCVNELTTKRAPPATAPTAEVSQAARPLEQVS
ncbi:MAG TPA: zinc ribbon domain-containing protein [Chloroflexota bacterium]|jgi:RNA polymerase subunit RPABC4/transcription elongation factor Spt4